MAMGIYSSGSSIAVGVSFAVGGWVAYEWGWRSTFLVVGLPGIVLAALIYFTVREPSRGAFEQNESGATDVAAPSFWTTIAYLWRTPSAVHIFVGYVISVATLSSYSTWITSLLVRVHQMNVRDAGMLIAFSVGFMGFVGAILGAYISDRHGKRSLKGVVVLIATAAAITAPLGIAMSFAEAQIVVTLLMMAVSITKAMYLGPAQGVLLCLAKVRMRGVAVTLLNVAGTLVGYSVGPLVVGALSFVLGGGIAIRYGLAVIFAMNLWAAFHFWLASRSLNEDLERAAK